MGCGGCNPLEDTKITEIIHFYTIRTSFFCVFLEGS